MSGIKVFIILSILLSIGACAVATPAMGITTSDTGVSNSAIIFENGKPVSQVVGPIGNSSVQPYNSNTYKFLDEAMYPQMMSHELVDWTITNEYINMTFADYKNGVFVMYDYMNLSISGDED